MIRDQTRLIEYNDTMQITVINWQEQKGIVMTSIQILHL